MLYEAETLQKYSSYKPLQILLFFLYENQLFSLVAMATWSFHTLILGRIEKWHLLSSHCRYYKTFIEMFLEKSSISRVCFGSIFGVTCISF